MVDEGIVETLRKELKDAREQEEALRWASRGTMKTKVVIAVVYANF